MEIESCAALNEETRAILARYKKGMPVFQVIRPIDPPEDITLRGRGPHGNSLRQICGKMLRCYHDKSTQDIFLNEFSITQKVERRRIYDVVNILEAFDIVSKKAKNVYVWKGTTCFAVRLKLLEAAERSGLSALQIFPFERGPVVTKKKLLTYLALRVLRCFSCRADVISFPEILEFCEPDDNVPRELLIGDDTEGKNRVRRLYDIINVFRALGLLVKCSQVNGKKRYLWKGEQGFSEQISLLKPSEDENLTPSPKIMGQVETEKVPAEPNKLAVRSAFKICKEFQGRNISEIRDLFRINAQNDEARD